jgi:hypothetical protein
MYTRVYEKLGLFQQSSFSDCISFSSVTFHDFPFWEDRELFVVCGDSVEATTRDFLVCFFCSRNFRAVEEHIRTRAG